MSGTSLQMIADAMGVTKAAVYHQFKTKEEIVIAVLEADLVRLESALDTAEAEQGPRAREVLLTLVIDLAVAAAPHRERVAARPGDHRALRRAQAVPGADGPPVRAC